MTNFFLINNKTIFCIRPKIDDWEEELRVLVLVSGSKLSFNLPAKNKFYFLLTNFFCKKISFFTSVI